MSTIHYENTLSSILLFLSEPTTVYSEYYIHWGYSTDGGSTWTEQPGSVYVNSNKTENDTCYTFTGITRGISYKYRARCATLSGSTTSFTRDITLPLPTISATATSNSVTVTLSNIDNSQGTSSTSTPASIYPFSTYITWKKKTGSSGDSGWSNDEDTTFNGQSSSLSHTYSGLSSGTTYSFKVSFSATYDTSQTLQLYKYNVTTTSSTSPPSISLTKGTVTSNSVVLTVSASSLRKTCYCYLHVNGSSSADRNYDIPLTTSQLSGSVTVTGLSPSTTYTFYYSAQYSGESASSNSNTVTVTTSAAPTVAGTLIFGNFYYSGTCICLRIKGATSGSTWTWYQRTNGSTGWTQKGSSTANSSGTAEYEFTNLNYGTFYDFKATSQGGEKIITRLSCCPQEASQHRTAYFSKETWTFMVDTVYTIRGSWTTSTSATNAPSELLTRANTRMDGTNGNVLTAKRMNSLWFNIYNYSNNKSGIRLPSSWFEQGDKVWASYFYNDLATAIYNML